MSAEERGEGKKEVDPVKVFFDVIIGIAKSCVEETLEKERDVVELLVELTGYWEMVRSGVTDLSSGFGQVVNYFRRVFTWSIVELTTGNYLEAARDVRAIIEYAILSYHLDEVLSEEDVLELRSAVAVVGLLPTLKWEGRKIRSRDERVRKEAEEKIRKKLKEKYEDLLDVMLKKETYYGVVDVARKLWEGELGELVSGVWSFLSDYVHYSLLFYAVRFREPAMDYVPCYEEKTFAELAFCLVVAFDVVCALVARAFPGTKDEVRKVVEAVSEEFREIFGRGLEICEKEIS